MKFRKFVVFTVLLGMLVGCGGSYRSGDRVLVAKYLYDTGITQPDRFDVVVFKYPKEPTDEGVPKNYIKRLLGLPGEIIAIFFGQLFKYHPDPDALPFDQSEVDAFDLWRKGNLHEDNAIFAEWFKEGKFEIIRKPPPVMLAMRRIVYDNDYQAKDMKDYRRWNPSPGSQWVAEEDYRQFKYVPNGDNKIDWLRYAHLTRPQPGSNGKPAKRLISDFMGYNAIVKQMFEGRINEAEQLGLNWVSDLMLECALDVNKAEGQFYMELSRGIYRLQAVFDLESGKCTLRKQGPEGGWQVLKSADTSVKNPGSYRLRFANFDARLTVWVNGSLPFGDGVDYPPPEIAGLDDKDLTQEQIRARRGPTEHDLEPASLGAKGRAALEVSHLRLWRDTYYSLYDAPTPDESDVGMSWNNWKNTDWSNPEKLDAFKELHFKTVYVHPDHFLCLGDNSAKSADSRSWGLVPRRLMLGRALVVYYPFSRIGPIR